MNNLFINIPKAAVVGLLPPITASSYNFLIYALEKGLSVAPFPQFHVNPIEEWKRISSLAKISTIVATHSQYNHLKIISDTFGIPANVILASEIVSLSHYETLHKAGQFYLNNLVKPPKYANKFVGFEGQLMYYNKNRHFTSIDAAALESLQVYVKNSILNSVKIKNSDTIICCSNSHLSYVLMILLNKLTNCKLNFFNINDHDCLQENVKIKCINNSFFKIWQNISEIDGNAIVLLDNQLLGHLEKTYNDNFLESANKVSCILNIDNISFDDGYRSEIFPNAVIPSLPEFPLLISEPILAGPFKTPFVRKRDLMKARPEGFVKRVPIHGKRWGNFTGRNRNWTLLFK